MAAAAPAPDRGSPADATTVPASHFLEALPVGNGRLGAMVFGRIHDERIPLNENSLWDGYARDTTNPEALAHLPEVRRLLFAGKHAEATELAGKHFMGRPPRIKPYQVLADLWLEGPAPSTVRQYRRELDLDTGIARVSYQATAEQTREIFASAPDEVIVVRMTGDEPGTVNTRVRLARWQDAKALPAAERAAGHCAGRSSGPTRRPSENRGLRFEACAQVQNEGRHGHAPRATACGSPGPTRSPS